MITRDEALDLFRFVLLMASFERLGLFGRGLRMAGFDLCRGGR